MGFFNLRKALVLSCLIFLVACGGTAKDPRPFGADDNTSTFTVVPGSVGGQAELTGSTPKNFGYPSEQILNLKVCLQDRALAQPVIGSPFGISDGSTESVYTTDVGGCLHWTEKHTVSYFSSESNIRIERQLIGRGNHRGTRKLIFDVDPLKDGTDAVKSNLNREAYANEIAVPASFGFQSKYPISSGSSTFAKFGLVTNHLDLRYKGFASANEFGLDQNLNLTVPYLYTFSFQPVIVRTGLSGEPEQTPLKSGRLRITFVLFAAGKTSPKDDSQYFASAQVDTDVSPEGQVTGTVIFKYPHMLFASGRQTLLLQVAASEPSDDILSQSFSGHLSYVDQENTIPMEPDPRDAGALHTIYSQKFLANQKAESLPLSTFLAHNDVTYTAVDDFPSIKDVPVPFINLGGWYNLVVTKEELRNDLSSERLSRNPLPKSLSRYSVRERLCRAYFTMNPVYTNMNIPSGFHQAEYINVLKTNGDFILSTLCSSYDIDRHIKFEMFDFVEKLVSPQPRNLHIDNFLNQEFGVYYSKDHSKGDSVGFAFHLPGAQELGGILDFNYNTFDTHTFTERGTFAATQHLTIDRGSLDINALVQTCVRVSSIGPSYPSKPWLVCLDRTREGAKWLHETFYYFSQIFGSNHSPFLDQMDSQAGIKIFVRGETHMKEIGTRLEKADFLATGGFNVFVHARPPDFTQFNTTGSVESLTDQAIPGAIGISLDVSANSP
jgi:hypothetical protein